MNYTLLTGEQIGLAHLLTLRAGLKLELLGMRHSTNAVFKAAKAITGERTRRGAFDKLDAMIKELNADFKKVEHSTH